MSNPGYFLNVEDPSFEKYLMEQTGRGSKVITKCTECPEFSFTGTLNEGHEAFLRHVEETHE